MTTNFEDILASMLEKLETDPNQNVGEMIAAKYKEMGISENGQSLFSETSECIGDFAEKAKSLTDAKAQGMSRQKWVATEMGKVMEGRTDTEKAMIATTISDACENMNKETLTEGEKQV